MKLESFSDPGVIDFLNRHFISISVDTDMQPALGKKWKVKGLPLLWFLKPDASKISNVPGFVDKDQLLQILSYIQSQKYDEMSFKEFIDQQQ